MKPKHGHRQGQYRDAPTGVYRAWEAMMKRCYTKSSTAYKDYGARGIKVCERWHTFTNFLEDMGERPEGKRVSVDRIDMTGNYEPGNCRWATPKQQANNRSSNRRIEYRGVTYTLQQLAEQAGLNKMTLWGRINKCGWPIEKAVKAPVRRWQ